MSDPASEPTPLNSRPAHEDPQEAGKQHQDLRRAQTAFLAHLRHELRTPINAIVGYSELLLEVTEEQGDQRFAADLQKINAAGRQLLALVNDIMSPTKIESWSEIRMEDFEGEVRHGLRTPINSVIGYVDMLLEDAEEAHRDDTVSDLHKIRFAGERLLGLINDILSLWQVQVGRSELGVMASDGFQMVQEAVTAIRPLAVDRAYKPVVKGGSVLVVDDNDTNRDLLSRQMQREGHAVSTAESGRGALEMLKAGRFDVVLLDILMPEMNGYQVLSHIKADESLRHIPVIMLSALDEIDSVVRCIELGAEDYLPKPVNGILLGARLNASLEKKWQRDRELDYLQQLSIERENSLRELLVDQSRGPAQILGNSRQAVQLRNQAEKAATNDGTLLILGEPGTERRTIAQLVHEKSDRNKRPFLCLDCANVQSVIHDERGGEGATFLEEIAQVSALFGHKSGSFSFAHNNRVGYLELAAGGTLLLDNADRLTTAVQERLLNYLQTGKLRRLGDSQEVSNNVRVIVASHPQLVEESARGTFDSRLYGLLSSQSITVPPLRDRKRDMTALVDHLIEVHSSRLGKEVGGITKEAMNMILAYHWPNNVEELEAVIQRGLRLADGPMLSPEQIFIGLAPFEARRKVDLLKVLPLRKVLESPLFPGVPQAVFVAVTGFIFLSALFGPQQSDSNLALILVWALWWPFLALGIFFTGRLFCAVCPMGAIGRFLQRWSLKRKVPGSIKTHGLYVAAAGWIVIIWAEQTTNMVNSPMATAFLLLTILTGAAGASLIFDRAAWCRYLCPLGRMIGTYATLSLVEVRSNTAVCSSECKTHGCFTGAERAKGCPMYEGPFAIQSNEFCKLCADCLKNCVNKAIRLNLRIPTSEVWSVPRHSLQLAVFVPLLMATIIGKYFRSSEPYIERLGSSDFEWLAFLGVLIVFSLAFGGAIALTALALRGPFTKNLTWLSYAFLPLALAGELGHQMDPLLSRAGSLIPTFSRQFGLGEWDFAYIGMAHATQGVRAVLLILGLMGSIYLVYRLVSRFQAPVSRILYVPPVLLTVIFSLVYGVIFYVG